MTRMTLKHTPNALEQSCLDDLLERFSIDVVPVRLTKTMLGKSIIDARAPLRYHLRNVGLVEYSALAQGSGGKLQVPLPFVTSKGVDRRVTSFYRPITKDGDPRIWVEKLASVAAPGDLLLFVFAGSTTLALLIDRDVEALSHHLSTLVPGRYEERGKVERTVERLRSAIAPLATEWFQTMRAGPTGVGFTFESLLGLAANSSMLADVDGVELKSYRMGSMTGRGKLMTLFSKTPVWTHEGRGLGLLNRYGYIDKDGRRALYCTVMKKKNSLGFELEPHVDAARLLVNHRKELAMEYHFATLRKRLEEKHPATLFVRAESRGRGAQEEFRYSDVTLCREPSFSNFLDLVEESELGLDLTLHVKENGSARDHGYLWRVYEPSIPRLFAYRRLLSGTALAGQ